MGEYVKLTKKEVRRAWFWWYKYCLCVFGFERLQAPGMILSQLPIINKFYKDDVEGRIALLKRHSTFFNTQPDLGALIPGMVLSFEENIANGKEISDEFIQNVKVGLMGPFAGIGDSLIQATLPPIILSIAIGLSSNGSFAGPILVLCTIPVIRTILNYYFFHLGYNLGENAVEYVLGDKMASLQTAMSVVGLTVTGAVTANYVKFKLALVYTSEQTTVELQSILDRIFPNILEIGIVLLGFWLLTKKKFTAVQFILLLLAVAIVGNVTGIL